MVNKAIRSAREEQQELEALHRLDEECVHQQRAGNYLKAFDCMERALVLRRHFFGVESDEVVQACRVLAEMCNLLAMSFLQQDNFTVTIDLLKKAEILTQRHHAAERATTLNNLACYYRRLGKLHAAMTSLKRALELEKRLQNLRNAADTHLNMCAVLSQLGKHQEALEHAQEALITLQEEFFQGKHAPDAATGDESTAAAGVTPSSRLDRLSVMCIAYHNIGVEQEFLKEYAESVISYKKGVGVAEQYLGVDHSITTTIRNSYLAAKRTMATKASTRSRGSASSNRDAASSTKSPSKATTRLLQSPRSGSMRLPSPLTKEKERHNIPQIPTPRSIIADALSRAPLSALPPLELERSPSAKKAGKKKAASVGGSGEPLSPSDPFFSPRFRFGDASTENKTKKLPQSSNPGKTEVEQQRTEEGQSSVEDSSVMLESASARFDGVRKSTLTARTEGGERGDPKSSRKKTSGGTSGVADERAASSGPDSTPRSTPKASARVAHTQRSARSDSSKTSGRSVHDKEEASVLSPTGGPSAASARIADDTSFVVDPASAKGGEGEEDSRRSTSADDSTVAVEGMRGPALEVALALSSDRPETLEMKAVPSPDLLPVAANVAAALETAQSPKEEAKAETCEDTTYIEQTQEPKQEQVQDQVYGPSLALAREQSVRESESTHGGEAEERHAIQDQEKEPEAAAATQRPASPVQVADEDQTSVPEATDAVMEEVHAQVEPEVSMEEAGVEFAPEECLVDEKANDDADDSRLAVTNGKEGMPGVDATPRYSTEAESISGPEANAQPDGDQPRTERDDASGDTRVDESEPATSSRLSEEERQETLPSTGVDDSSAVEVHPEPNEGESPMVVAAETSELTDNCEPYSTELTLTSGEHVDGQDEVEETATTVEITPSTIYDHDLVTATDPESPGEDDAFVDAIHEESEKLALLGMDGEESHHVEELSTVEDELAEEPLEPTADANTSHEISPQDDSTANVETTEPAEESLAEEHSQVLSASEEGNLDAQWHSSGNHQHQEPSLHAEDETQHYDASEGVEAELHADYPEEPYSGEGNSGLDDAEESTIPPGLGPNADAETARDSAVPDPLAEEITGAIHQLETDIKLSDPSEEYGFASSLAENEHGDAAAVGDGYDYDWNYTEQPEQTPVDDTGAGAVQDGETEAEAELQYAYETAECDPEVQAAVESIDYSGYYHDDGSPADTHDMEHHEEGHTDFSYAAETPELAQYSHEQPHDGAADLGARLDEASWPEGEEPTTAEAQNAAEPAVEREEEH